MDNLKNAVSEGIAHEKQKANAEAIIVAKVIVVAIIAGIYFRSWWVFGGFLVAAFSFSGV